MPAPEVLHPFLENLPEPVAEWLRGGGWLIVGIALALFLLLLILSVLRRLLGRKKKAPAEDAHLTEDVRAFPAPPALWGEKRLTLHGLPVRMRLVVAAPLGTEGGTLKSEEVEKLLDQIMPGLSYFVRIDKPRIRTWPTQLSQLGFLAAFRRHTLLPDADQHVSRWIRVMGRVLYDRRPFVLGMILLADQDNTLQRVQIDHPHQWMEVLRIKGA